MTAFAACSTASTSQVPAGTLISLLGPSGCGKSTALRIIAGLIAPSGGRILVSGRDITALPAHARRMGLVFQNYALFPHHVGGAQRRLRAGDARRGRGATSPAGRATPSPWCG